MTVSPAMPGQPRPPMPHQGQFMPGHMMNPNGMQFQQRGPQGAVQHQMPPHFQQMPPPMMGQPMMPAHMMQQQQRMMNGFPPSFVGPQGMMAPRGPMSSMPQMVAKQPMQIPGQHVFQPHTVNPVAQQRDGPAFQFVETAVVHAPPHLVQQPQMRQPQAATQAQQGVAGTSQQVRSSKPRGSYKVSIVDPNTKQDVTSVSDDSNPTTPISGNVSANLVPQPFEQPVRPFENPAPEVSAADELPNVTVSLSPAGTDQMLFGNMPSELTTGGSPVRQQSRMKFATTEPPIMSLDGLPPGGGVMVAAQVDIVHDVLADMENTVDSMNGLDDDVQLIGIGSPGVMPSTSSTIKPATESLPVPSSSVPRPSDSVPSTSGISSEKVVAPPVVEPVVESTKEVTPVKANRFAPPKPAGANRFAPAKVDKPVEPVKPAPRPKDRKKLLESKEGHGTLGNSSLMDAFTVRPAGDTKDSKPAEESKEVNFSTPLSQASTAREEEHKKDEDEEWEKQEPSTAAAKGTPPKDEDEEDDWEHKDPSELELCFRPSSSLGAGCSWGSGTTRSAKKEEARFVYSLAVMKKYQKLYTTPHPELSTLDEELKEEVVDLYRDQNDRSKPGSWRQGMAPPPATTTSTASPLSWRNQEQRMPEGSPNWDARSSSIPRSDPMATLARSENRWVPKKNTSEDEVVLKKVVGLLNKLTMEKFERLTEDLLTVGIHSLFVLKGVIGLIFEKALAEQKFAAMYSELCVRLATGCPEFETEENGKTAKVTFKKILLNKCQEEFENAGKIVEPENLDAEEKEVFHIKRRMRLIGLIKFICELFKKRMVAEKIMHACILHLLKKPEDEEMECLCKLFEGAGHMLDREAAKQHMDSYFERMSKFPRSQFSSRVRFMMQDVVALRRCHWEPRNTLTGPQTLAEIRRGVTV